MKLSFVNTKYCEHLKLVKYLGSISVMIFQTEVVRFQDIQLLADLVEQDTADSFRLKQMLYIIFIYAQVFYGHDKSDMTCDFTIAIAPFDIIGI